MTAMEGLVGIGDYKWVRQLEHLTVFRATANALFGREHGGLRDIKLPRDHIVGVITFHRSPNSNCLGEEEALIPLYIHIIQSRSAVGLFDWGPDWHYNADVACSPRNLLWLGD